MAHGGKGQDGIDDTTWLVILLVGGPLLVAAVPRVRNRLLDRIGLDQGSRWRGSLGDILSLLLPWLIGLAVVYLLWRLLVWAWRRRRARRAAIQERIWAHLEPVIGRGWEPTQLRISWRHGRPAQLRVTLPTTRAVPHDDPDWRRELVSAAELAVGTRLAATWPAPVLSTKWRGPLRQHVLLKLPTSQHEHQVDQAQDQEAVRSYLLPLLPAKSEIAVTRDDAGELVEVTVRYGETTRDMSPSWRARLSTQLSHRVGGQWLGTWDTTSRIVTLTPVPSLPDVVPWCAPPARQPDSRPIAPYGVDEAGNVMAWEMGDRHPHTVVVGPTGTGKTETMKGIVAGALYGGGVAVVILDRKFKDFAVFLGYPGVVAVASTVEDCAAMIEALVEEMHRRVAAGGLERLWESDPTRLSDAEREQVATMLVSLLIVVDEHTQLVGDLKTWWLSMSPDTRLERYGTKSTICPHIDMLSQIAQLARSCYMHLLIGMQRADVKNFGDSTQMRDNLPHRITMGSMSGIGSEQVWGDRATGQILVEHIGEGVTNAAVLTDSRKIEASGRPRRFRSVYVSDDELRTPTFREHVASGAPDLSRIDVGRVSEAAMSIEVALTSLRERAGLEPSTGSVETAPPLQLVEPTGETVEAGEPAEDRARVTRSAVGDIPPTPPAPADELVAEESDGGVWEQVAAAVLVEGDWLDTDNGRVQVTAEPEWIEDEVTGDELLRLEVETAEGSPQVWDYSGEDLVTRKKPD